MKCKGFLFDLDGTLVDSLPVIERTWINWAVERRLDPQEVLAFIHGKQAIASLRHFMPGESEEAVQKAYRTLEKIEVADAENMKGLPGAHLLLSELNRQHIPWAIVTSGTVSVSHARYTAANLPEPSVFITAEDVKKGKPYPDAFLLGAERLDLPSEQCVVVEDAAAGVIAGLAAGCKVIAVNVPQDTPGLENVDFVLKTLEDLKVETTLAGILVTLR